MLELHPTDHNMLIVILKLFSPLMDPKVEIPESTELTTVDHVSQKNLSEVKVFQTVDQLDIGYHEGYNISANLSNSSHNIPTMTRSNH
jgi:hypothetical protein